MHKAKNLFQSYRKKNPHVSLQNGNAHNIPVNAESLKHMDTSDAELRKAHLSSYELPLNSDVLSAIFIACAELEWRSPAIIAAVCRLWREIVLATPRAWQYFRNLDNSLELREDAMALWINRSGCLPLHMHLSRKCRGPRQQIALDFRHRFECLTIHHLFNGADLDYPSLKYLAFFDDFWFEPLSVETPEGPAIEWTVAKAISSLNRKRYPVLQSLTVISRTTTLKGLDLKPNFPQLQKLDLKVRNLGNWGAILYHCAETLVSLTFEIYAEDPSTWASGNVKVLDLPRLRHLSLNHFWVRSRPTPFNFAAPFLEVLETVHASQAHGSINFVNTSNITHLIYEDKRDLDLTLFSAVQQVLIVTTADILDSVCNSLLGNSDLCPHLSSIVYWDPQTKFNRRMTGNLATERNIVTIPAREMEDWKRQKHKAVPSYTISVNTSGRIFQVGDPRWPFYRSSSHFAPFSSTTHPGQPVY